MRCTIDYVLVEIEEGIINGGVRALVVLDLDPGDPDGGPRGQRRRARRYRARGAVGVGARQGDTDAASVFIGQREAGQDHDVVNRITRDDGLDLLVVVVDDIGRECERECEMQGR